MIKSKRVDVQAREGGRERGRIGGERERERERERYAAATVTERRKTPTYTAAAVHHGRRGGSRHGRKRDRLGPKPKTKTADSADTTPAKDMYSLAIETNPSLSPPQQQLVVGNHTGCRWPRGYLDPLGNKRVVHPWILLSPLRAFFVFCRFYPLC